MWRIFAHQVVLVGEQGFNPTGPIESFEFVCKMACRIQNYWFKKRKIETRLKFDSAGRGVSAFNAGSLEGTLYYDVEVEGGPPVWAPAVR